MVIQDTTTGTETIIPQDLLTDLTRSLAQFPPVITVILYGSTARMSTTPLSDTDVCVLTSPGLTPEEWESIMSHTGPALDLVLFHDLSPSVRYRVIREGKILFCRDRKALHRIKTGTIRQYLDLQPFIDRNARRILKKPIL
jgi:uncharacterized protein